MTACSDAEVHRALEQQHLFAFVWSGFDFLHPAEAFRPAWHVEAICHALERVAAGTCRRLLITVPPRHGKSICTAVCFPAWMLGRQPTLKIMVASYGGDLANKHAGDFRKIVAAPFYRRNFPNMGLAEGGNRADEQLTTQGGGRKAISLGGAVTGFSADIIIIDDLMKAADATSVVERQRAKDFYEQTLLSRLNNQETGRIIVIQQRLHEDDLPGYLIEKGQFEHLNLPAMAIHPETTPIGFGLVRQRGKNEALCPDHLSVAALNELRIDMGDAAFSAQYQQDPTPPGGNRIRWEWFGTYDDVPARHELQHVVQSWDTALMTGLQHDFSVGMTWGLRNEDWLLLDVVRERLEFPALKSRIMATARRWNPDVVVIEQAGSGISLQQQLRVEDKQRWKYAPHKPKQDKETRLEAVTARLDGGRYLLPVEAPWLGDLRSEWLASPKGRHDDQVDSLVQFLEYIHERRWQSHMHRDPGTGRHLGGKRVHRTWRVAAE